MSTQKRRTQKAVALGYRPDCDNAPRVRAVGSGTVAEKIIQLAREHGVPIQKDDDLVEVLSLLEVEQEIPPQLYAAVAEILAFIYRCSSRPLKA